MFTQCGSVVDGEGDVFAVKRLTAAEVRYKPPAVASALAAERLVRVVDAGDETPGVDLRIAATHDSC